MTHTPVRRYLDNAATSFPKPPAVAQAMLRFMDEVGAPGRGVYAEAREAGQIIRQCRQRIARLVNLASPEHVIFGLNTSDGLNLGVHGTLAAARAARPNDRLHVVSTTLEHNSILRPLHAAMERDSRVSWTKVAPDPVTGLVDPSELAKAVRPGETVLVCVNHASNVTGVVQDLRAIGTALAPLGAGSDDPRGVALLVDGAQSLGHTLVDMRAMHIDLLAFPGHKGLLGPQGTGGLCIRPGFEHRLATHRQGGTGNVSELESHPQMLPEKYESGSHNTVGIAGLSEGVAWILSKGVDTLREHEAGLSRRFLEGLREVRGLKLLGPTDVSQRVGVFSVVDESGSLSPAELSGILEASFGLLTRAGLHCAPLVHTMLGTITTGGATRFSFGPFTTEEDVDAAVKALGEVFCSVATR